MALIAGFRDLEVYKLARQLSKRTFYITKSFPKEEKFSLTDQIRRASRAINAMIAEGWARRRYPAAFINKINEAMGEAMEAQSWLDHALDCEYIDSSIYHEMDNSWQRVGAMLNRMIELSHTFCKTTPNK